MFDLSASSLFASLIWGSLGSGFFIFGWKQKILVHSLVGIALTAASYFCETAVLMSCVSIFILLLFAICKRKGY
jgi:hypothetical protein